MYSNQNIRKKHAANKIGNMAVSTSLVMFPLRIETRFMKRYVDDASEPDLAIRAFMAFETFLEEAETYYETPERLLEPARLLLDAVERLDAIYTEDKARLRDLLQLLGNKIIGHIENEQTEEAWKLKLADLWTRIMNTLPRLVCIDELSAHKATKFLNTFEHVVRRLHNMVKNPNYLGHKRSYKVNKYSYTIQFTNARKNLRECNNFFKTIYYKDKDFSKYLDTITHFTGEQQKKFVRLLKGLRMDFTPLRTMYKVDEGRGKAQKDLFFISKGYYRTLEELEKHLTRVRNERLDLNIKSSRMVRHYQRYTLLAERLLHFRIINLGNPEAVADQTTLKRWRDIAYNTVFNFHVEYDWLYEMVKAYNTRVEEDPDAQLQVDLFRGRLLLSMKKKMCYKKFQKCLCVRIYPDEIAVTQMTAKLSQSEFDDAKQFWKEWKKVKGNDVLCRALWKGLCDKYPPYRAAWIVRQTYSAATIKQCGKPIDDEEANKFTVPYTRLLPDRFVLQATLKKSSGSERDIYCYGHLIPHELQVGLDLNQLVNLAAGEEGDNSLVKSNAKLKGAMRWLTDYDEAERMGMAITLSLEPFAHMRHNQRGSGKQNHIERKFEFNSLYVMGIKHIDDNYCVNSEKSQELVRNLFNAHLYSEEGFELLNMGTPTNIMGDGDERRQTGNTYDTSTENLVKAYYDQTLNLLKDKTMPLPYGDARMLSNLFKMPVRNSFGPKNINNPFINTTNRNNREVNKAQLVNKAFLGLMANKGNAIAKLIRGNDELRKYFMYSVLSSGAYPAVRIGSQPYGILPVCDFREMTYWRGSALHVLHEILLYLTKFWNNIVVKDVLHEDNMSVGNSQTNFLRVINSTPYSSTFYSRTVANQNMLFSPYFFRGKQRNEQPFVNLFNVVEKATGANGLYKEMQRQFLQEYENVPFTDDRALCRLKDNPFKDIVYTVKKFVKNRKNGMTLSNEEVELLITEAFDLFNYRLDAWMQGLLHYRLTKRMRRSRKHHIAIGAFGWVFNLRESETKNKLDEYMLAPSVNQALTAAVLRSSFKRSHVDTGGEKGYNYDLSINLSSERVRQALRIIKGVQNGLSLGAILGNDFERMLHEDYKQDGGYEMDFFIFYLRQLYPLDADIERQGKIDKPSDVRVLNGVALLNDLRKRLAEKDNKRSTLTALYLSNKDEVDKWFESLGGSSWAQLFDSRKRERLFVLLQELEDAYDALADVVNSECVYKLCEGNRVAVEALMNCVQSESNIPLPDVVNIPLNSAHVEQRMLVALDVNAKAPKHSSSPLQMAEPALDQWMGEMMGYNQMRFSFTLLDKTHDVKAAELGLSPSDIVYLSGDKDRFNRFLAVKCWMQQQAVSQEVIDAPTVVQGEELPFEEAELAVDNLREMLSSTRMLRMDDLIVNGAETPDEAYDISELGSRCDVLKSELKRLADYMAAWLKANGGKDNAASLSKEAVTLGIEHLLGAFRLGLFNALDAVTDDLMKFAATADAQATAPQAQQQAAFVQALTSQLEQLNTRLSASEQLLDGGNKVDVESLTQSAKKMLVNNFVMAPHFNADTKLRPGSTYTDTEMPLVNLESLEQQKQGGCFSNVSQLDMESWLMDVGRVRQPMQLLHQLRMFAKCNALETNVSLTPMQLPIQEKESQWVGLQVEDEKHVHDANSFMVMNASRLVNKQDNAFQPMAGVVLDFWVERIPYKMQTAALTFGYDQPDAEPPQAILVGVSTRGGKHRWSEKHVLGTLKAAMRMAKSRAVSPEDVYKNRWTSCIFPLLNYPTQK